MEKGHVYLPFFSSFYFYFISLFFLWKKKQNRRSSKQAGKAQTYICRHVFCLEFPTRVNNVKNRGKLWNKRKMRKRVFFLLFFFFLKKLQTTIFCSNFFSFIRKSYVLIENIVLPLDPRLLWAAFSSTLVTPFLNPVFYLVVVLLFISFFLVDSFPL